MALKLPLDTLLLPNSHRDDCTSVSLICRPEAIRALATLLHQLVGPVMILSPPPQYATPKLPLDTLLHYKRFLTPKFPTRYSSVTNDRNCFSHGLLLTEKSVQRKHYTNWHAVLCRILNVVILPHQNHYKYTYLASVMLDE